MKKLIVGSVLAAFALVPALQAGEKNDKASAPVVEKDKAACAGKTECCAKALTKVNPTAKGAHLWIAKR